MLGSEEDWKSLIDKLEQVEDLLKPIDQVLQMAKWFASSKAVLKNLLETFRGNPDKDWWGRIMTVEYFGSGLHTMLTGWFVQDLLGFRAKRRQCCPHHPHRRAHQGGGGGRLGGRGDRLHDH